MYRPKFFTALARVLPFVLLSLVLSSVCLAQAGAGASPAATAGVGILVLQPGSEGKDAGAYALSPTTNYGDLGWYYGIGLPGIGIGYLEFDLTDLPADAVVTSATLDLWAEYNDGTLSIDAINAPWDEATLTWSNRPSSVYPSLAVTYAISRGDPSGPCYWGCVQTFDVTGIVQAWATGAIPNRGFQIVGDTGSVGWLMASSDNTSNPRPRLWIQYDSQTPTARPSWGELKSYYR